MRNNYIVFDPKIMGGKATIKATRISVDFILELLASGMTQEEILREYPSLTRPAIKAALEYASLAIRREEVVLNYN